MKTKNLHIMKQAIAILSVLFITICYLPVGLISVSAEIGDTMELGKMETGEFDHDYNAYWYFYPEETGYYRFFSEGANYPSMYAVITGLGEGWESVAYGDCEDFDLRAYLSSGCGYLIEVRTWDEESYGEITVGVEKVELESMEITDYDFYATYGDKNFSLVMNWSDGLVDTWDFSGDDIDAWAYWSGAFNGEYVEDEEGATVSCNGLTSKVYWPDDYVKSIEKVNDYTITLIENSVGYWDEDYSDEWRENYEEYFHYDYYSEMENVDLEVTYMDGQTEITHPNSYLERNEQYVDYWDDQWSDHWMPGSENVLYYQIGKNRIADYATILPNPIESIEVIESDVTMEKEVDGYWSEEYYYDDDIGEEYYENVFYYYVSDFLDTVKVKVNYKDGTSEQVWANQDMEYEGVSFGFITSELTDKMVDAGDTTFTLSLCGASAKVPFTIVESPIANIEILGEIKPLIENNNGYWNINYDDEEYYHYFWDEDDIQVKINLTDGTNRLAEIDDYVEIGGRVYEVRSYSNQYDTPWQLGNNNYVTVEVGNATCDIPVTIISSPVKSIETIGSIPSIIENGNGWWDYDGQFVYSTDNLLDNISYKINLVDGTSITTDSRYFYVNDVCCEIDIDDDQYENPWYVGTNYLTVSSCGKSTQIPVTIVESPIEYLEIKGNPLVVIENANGWWEYDEDENEFFYYSYSIPKDSVIAHFADGSSKIVDMNNGVTINEVNYYCKITSNQYDEHWQLGSDNYITLSLCGKTVDFPVTVVENPVVSIEMVGELDPVMEYANGRYVYSSEEKVIYQYSPNLENVNFKVNLKDGTSLNSIFEDGEHYVTINGTKYFVEVTSNQGIEQWTLTGDKLFEFSVANKSVLVPVTMIENPIKSLEVVQGLGSFVENAGGIWGYDENDKMYFHYDLYDDGGYSLMKDVLLKVTFNDDTNQTVSAADGITIGNYTITFEISDTQYESPWKVGKTDYITVSVKDISVKIPVSIKSDRIASLELYKGSLKTYLKNVDGYEYTYHNSVADFSKFIYDVDVSDAIIKVNYKDGGYDFVHPGEQIEPEKWTIGTYHLQRFFDEPQWDTNTDNYVIAYVGDKKVQIPVTIVAERTGDVNGDAQCDLKDVLLLRKHIAKFTVELNLQEADVYRDGFIDLKDVLTLRKKIAAPSSK